MSSGYSRVTLVGHIGHMELRYTAQELAVLSMSIAENYEYKDKESGEKVEKVEWHRVIGFGSLAEAASKYQEVGSKVLVEGKLRTRKYEDKEGVQRYVTETVLDRVIFLDKSEKKAIPDDAIERLKKLSAALEEKA